MEPQSKLPPDLADRGLIDQLIAEAYHVGIIRAAIELDLWGKVASGQDTADALVATQRWDPWGTRALLDDLTDLKLLEQEGNRYRPTPAADCYLRPDRPSYYGRLFLTECGWEGNGKLAEAIRTGKRPIAYAATTKAATDVWADAYSSNTTAPAAYLERAEAMWNEMGIQPREGLEVLDAACGPAPRSFALARGSKGVRVTLLDWGRILAIAVRLAAELGLAEQVTSVEADLKTASFNSNQYDAIYLGNVTHFLTPEQNTDLFGRLCGALSNRGALIVNCMRRESRSTLDPQLWLYAVSEGAAYDAQEYAGMLKKAGFPAVEVMPGGAIKAMKG